MFKFDFMSSKVSQNFYEGLLVPYLETTCAISLKTWLVWLTIPPTHQQIRDPRLPLPYLLTSIYINLNIKQKSRQHKIKIEKILNPYTQCQPTDLSLSKRDIPSVWGWKFIEVRQKVGTGMAKMLNLETSILARCSLGQHCCQHCCQLCQNGTKYKQDTTNNIGFSFWLRLGAQGVTLSVCPSVRHKVL